jgi:hypothetical protein
MAGVNTTSALETTAAAAPRPRHDIHHPILHLPSSDQTAAVFHVGRHLNPPRAAAPDSQGEHRFDAGNSAAGDMIKSAITQGSDQSAA